MKVCALIVIGSLYLSACGGRQTEAKKSISRPTQKPSELVVVGDQFQPSPGIIVRAVTFKDPDGIDADFLSVRCFSYYDTGLQHGQMICPYK